MRLILLPLLLQIKLANRGFTEARPRQGARIGVRAQIRLAYGSPGGRGAMHRTEIGVQLTSRHSLAGPASAGAGVACGTHQTA